jgi:hypothetical protein
MPPFLTKLSRPASLSHLPHSYAGELIRCGSLTTMLGPAVTMKRLDEIDGPETWPAPIKRRAPGAVSKPAGGQCIGKMTPPERSCIRWGLESAAKLFGKQARRGTSISATTPRPKRVIPPGAGVFQVRILSVDMYN